MSLFQKAHFPLLSAFLLVNAALLPALSGAANETGLAGAAFPKVKLSTSKGEIVLELDRDHAPVSVDNFLQYVDSNFYDNTIFHRVIEGFMIQGGGFTTTYNRKPAGTAIRNEANNGLKNLKYTISMARTNAPHSATAQFFINAADNDYLDHRAATARDWGYAVFGRVIVGFDIVDAISQVPTGAGGPFSRDAPKTPVVILSAAVLIPPAETAEAQSTKSE